MRGFIGWVRGSESGERFSPKWKAVAADPDPEACGAKLQERFSHGTAESGAPVSLLVLPFGEFPDDVEQEQK